MKHALALLFLALLFLALIAAAPRRERCKACPGGHFLGLSDDGLVAECARGKVCCGGKVERGSVHLATGACTENHWPKDQTP